MSRPRHLLGVSDLDTTTVLELLDRAEALRTGAAPLELGRRWVAGLLFFESSTRTRLGFQSAVLRLGGGVALLDGFKHEAGMSAAESLEDTVRCAAGACDLLVLRHPGARSAASVSPVPVINAGDGRGEHPTQALIDLFAIRRAFGGRLEGLRVGVVGDVDGSRCARSFLSLLERFSPREIRRMTPADGRELAPEGLDVLYMAGLPEGAGAARVPKHVRQVLSLTTDRMRALPDHAIVLCPLPRIDEIDRAVDADPRARYFEQCADGLHMRLALVERVLRGW